MGYSERWAEYFREHPPSPEVQANFDRETRESLQAQRDIEESEGISFEQHLDNFFSQYKALQTGAG
jgi:glutamate--cysteine ligase